MKLNKICATLALAATGAFAQIGAQGGEYGYNQYTATTLGQWNVTAGAKGYITIDNWALSRNGEFWTEDGKKHTLNAIMPTGDAGVFAGVGVLDFIDMGFFLPYYYDHANSDAAAEADLWAAGFGDLELWTKIKAPFFSDESMFNIALQMTLYVPTGEDGYGMRVRHPWYINSFGGYTQPFTADQWAGAATLIGTLDLQKADLPFVINGHVGFVGAFDYGANTVVWGGGVNWLVHEYVDIFAEFHAETRVEKTNIPRQPYDLDPMYITPGFRWHLPWNVDFVTALDVGLNNINNPTFKSDREKDQNEWFYVKRKGGDSGKKSKYLITNEPHYALAGALIWTLNKKNKNQDSDGDGVNDKDDKCPNTPSAATVDANGCVLDTDKDSIPDYLDKCPNTQAGSVVDSTGCPMDSDKDGVADGVDKCENTPEGASVDSTGCPIDTDKDGIPNGQDKCPNTKEGVKVDETGCPVDSDKDGVYDSEDKCANTPEGTEVDATGCPLDSDKDGIPNGQDKCPNTPAGVAVDSTGCSPDADTDGVPDALDKCPNTPAGVTVDSTGCAADADKDGVADDKDKCPNTKQGVTVDETGCAIDSDKDGVADDIDQCPNTKQGTTVDTTGCPMDSDGDGIPDDQDKCPNTIKGQEIDKYGCPLNKKQDLSKLRKGINFKTGSAELTKNSFGTLNDVASLLNQFPEAGLEVQGHTDNTGSSEKNKELSSKRAESVTNYLEKKGVDGGRLRAVGYGDEKPIADNKTKDGRAKNRRVELVPFNR